MRWIVLGLSILVLLLNTGCSCNKRNLGAKKKNINYEAAKEVKKAKKLLLSVKEVKGQLSYIVITIKPSCAGAAIENYFITAKVLEGQGQLLGAKEKVKNRLQYEVQLEDRCLASLLPSKGNADIFRSGNQIEFKSRYDPREGTKKGDTHQLAITVMQKDEEGKTIHQEQAKLTLSVKQDINERPKI